MLGKYYAAVCTLLRSQNFCEVLNLLDFSPKYNKVFVHSETDFCCCLRI